MFKFPFILPVVAMFFVFWGANAIAASSKHNNAMNGVYCDSPLGKDMLKCKQEAEAQKKAKAKTQVAHTDEKPTPSPQTGTPRSQRAPHSY